MATISLQAIYLRTQSGDFELSEPRIGLSVTQRKLLSLLDGNTSLGLITHGSKLEIHRVERDAARLLDLGLVKSTSESAREQAPPIVVPTVEHSHKVTPVEAPANWVPSASTTYRPAKTLRYAALATGCIVVLGTVITWLVMRKEPSKPIQQPKEVIAERLTPSLTEPTPTTEAHRETIEVVGTPPPKTITAPVVNQPISKEVKEKTPLPGPTATTPKTSPTQPTVQTATGQTAQPSSALPAATQTKTQTSTQAAETTRPVVQQATPQPTPSTPVEPPPTQIAKASPTITPAETPRSAYVTLTPTYREQPEFPREAIYSGVNSGRVVARMNIDANGNVNRVDILESEPKRVFDRAVQRALLRWKFQATGEPRVADTEVAFTRN